jgi:hypothetical protein
MAKRILLGLVAVLIVMQFFRPTLNVASQPPTKDDFVVRYAPPPEIQQILAVACYDCHSNTTRYPWYAQAQPVGWWLGSHINDGKFALNFSEFGSYAPKRQARKLNQISDQLTEHTMPLRSYTWIHRDARLSDAQIRTVTDWMDALHDKIAPEE